jgi:anti-anti-sigma factor
MALFRVMIPYREPASGAQVRYATLEVEAEGEPVVRRQAMAEFEEMAVFGGEASRPEVIERDIRVERAPLARRSAFDVTIKDLGPRVASARLTGSLNTHNFHRLQEALDELKDRGVVRLVLDLGGLSYVNSTGLSLFVAAGDLFDLRLAAVPVKIGSLLRMIGLDKLFQSFSGVIEAANAPGGRGARGT